MPDTLPQAGQLEQRSAPAVSVDGARLRGVVPYDVESRDLGGFTERMAPGCLRRTHLDDLVATVDHAGLPLGRYPGTVTIEDRDDGLHWSVELPESRADVREAVERGDLRASSWRMVVARDSWQGNVRTVEEVRELRDVAVVTNPAYPGATAEYRSAPEPSTAAPAAPEPNPEERAMPPATDPRLAVVEVVRDQPEPEPPADRQPEERAAPAGGLRVEDRAAEPISVESRVLDAMRSVNRGEARSLTTVDSSAGPLAPPELSTFLWDRLRPTSVMLAAGVRVIPTDRESVVWPRLTADVNPDWYAETETISAGDPAFGELEAKPRKLAHRVEMSNEVVDDSNPSLVDVLNGHLSTVLALKLDHSMLEGNPSTQPDGIRGLKYVSGIQTVDLGTDGSALADYDPFVEAVGLLAAANVPGPYAIVAHPRTATGLALLKDESGSARQLVRPADLPPVYATPQISVTEAKGAASDATSAYVFAPQQVVLVRRRDATIEMDRSRLFDKDMSEIRAKLRADLIVPNPQAVVRITGITP